MKKILGVVTIVTVLFMMLITTSNAATMTVDKTSVKKGDIVTVTVKADAAVDVIQFDLTYDADAFEYVENSVQSALLDNNASANNGVLTVLATANASETADKLTVQFKAKKDVTKTETANFTIDAKKIQNTETGARPEKVANTTAKVEIVKTETTKNEETKTEDTKNEETKTEETKTDAAKEEKASTTSSYVDDNGKKITKLPKTDAAKEEKASTTSSYVDDNGKKITKLPKTGSNVAIIFAFAAILGVVAAGYNKIIKK